jgi:hypothetical protein
MRLFVALAVAVLVWVGNAWGDTLQFQYTTLDYPGGINTQATGVDGNNVVGYYDDPNSQLTTFGLVYNLSTATYTAKFGDPLAGVGQGTFPYAISGNNIVGYFVDSAGQPHGFLYNGSGYTTINDPLAGNDWYLDGTFVEGISGNNIVGWYRDISGECHGFIYNGSTYTTIDAPLAGSNHTYLIQGTLPYGISGNDILGAYVDASDVYHGFVYDMLNQSFTTLDDPLSVGSFGTIATGMSGGNIAGIYYSSLGEGYTAAHGFLYNGSTYTTLDDPWGVSGTTYVEGISGNTIVGWCSNSNDNTDGFVATAIPEPSTLTLLAAGAIGLVGYGLRRRRQRRLSAATPETTASDESPAILSFHCRTFEAKRRAA